MVKLGGGGNPNFDDMICERSLTSNVKITDSMNGLSFL